MTGPDPADGRPEQSGSDPGGAHRDPAEAAVPSPPDTLPAPASGPPAAVPASGPPAAVPASAGPPAGFGAAPVRFEATPPPPGPGVTPPFPAPPHEGRSTRLWMSLGVAALAVVLCCGGGVAAAIGLAVTSFGVDQEQARAVVGDYLDDLKAGEYTEAYDALCEGLRRRETAQEFAARMADEPRIQSFELGELDQEQLEDPPRIVQRAEVTYTRGGRVTLGFLLVRGDRENPFEVCGLAG